MKSKTSFFNLKYMKKNLCLYWPIWTIYTLLLLLIYPAGIWSSYNYQNQLNYGMKRELTMSECYEVIGQGVRLFPGIVLVLIMSAITAMALFYYLYNSKSANMIHALPLTRMEIYVTNVVTGLLILIVPQFLTFVVSVLVSVYFGVFIVEYIALWLLAMMGAAIISFALAVVCAMFTGQLFAIPVLDVIVNFAFIGLVFIRASYMNYVGIGLSLSYNGTTAHSMRLADRTWLSPAYYLLEKLCFRQHYYYDVEARATLCDGIVFEGGKVLAGYMVAAVLLYIVGGVLYKRRQIEQAGNPIAVVFLRPVFRWGIGFAGGSLGAILLSSILKDMFAQRFLGLLLALVLIFGGICYFVAQMILEKSFRVFRKQILLECLGFMAVMAIFYGGMRIEAHREQNYVPDIQEIAAAGCDFSCYMKDNGRYIEEIAAIHQKIVDNCEHFGDTKPWEEECYYIDFQYWLVNGSYIRRNYRISANDPVGREILSQILEIEKQPDNYMTYVFGSTSVDYAQYDYGTVECTDEEWNRTFYAELDAKSAATIAEALCKDIEDGNVQFYNLNYLDSSADENRTCSISLEMRHPIEEKLEQYDMINGHYVYEKEDYSTPAVSEYTWVEIGRRCTNTLRALQECGVITSVEELNLAY